MAVIAPFRTPSTLVRVLAADLGLSPADLLRAAGLPGDALAAETLVLEPRAHYALFEALDELSDGRGVAISVAEALSTDAFDPAIFAAVCSPNLTAAAERIARHKQLLGPVRLRVDADADGLEIHDLWPAGEQPPPLLQRLAVSFWVALARSATRTRVVPDQVVLPAAASNLVDLESWLGVRVTRGTSTHVRFRPIDARRPFLTADASMWAFFEPALRKRLAELDTAATTSARVRAALLELLPAGGGTTAQVARELGVSTRTLQRRLAEEDATFQDVLATTREELARHYLTTSELPLVEIAFLLGYDDPSSFHRAFHQWTGQTPMRLREAAV